MQRGALTCSLMLLMCQEQKWLSFDRVPASHESSCFLILYQFAHIAPEKSQNTLKEPLYFFSSFLYPFYVHFYHLICFSQCHSLNFLIVSSEILSCCDSGYISSSLLWAIRMFLSKISRYKAPLVLSSMHSNRIVAWIRNNKFF